MKLGKRKSEEEIKNEVEIEEKTLDSSKVNEETNEKVMEVQKDAEVGKVDKKFTFNFSFSMLNLICSISTIAFAILAQLLVLSKCYTAGKVFVWFSAITLIAALTFFVIEAIKTKKVSFNPIFVMLCIAIIVFINLQHLGISVLMNF